MNKKGMELSVGFIVMLIIVIIVFAGSIYFIKEFFYKAEELKYEIERSTQEQIESLLQQGSLVSLPVNIKESPIGNSETFGLGIRNVGDTKGFRVVVSFNKAIDSLGEVIVDESYKDFINENWLLYDTNEFYMDSNELKVLPIAVRPDFNINDGEATKTGDYLFNICVFADTVTDDTACSIDAFKFSETKQEYYTKKMYSLTIKVK
jgi:archaellum component FlaG (FlaF/FlaG flagellin family)